MTMLRQSQRFRRTPTLSVEAVSRSSALQQRRRHASRKTVNRISAEFRKAVNSTDIKSKFEAIGIDPVGSRRDEGPKFLDDEIAKRAKVVSTAGVKAER
jgi:hypothetical protein